MFEQVRFAVAGLTVAATIALAGPAHAAFTPIGSNPAEPTLFDILDAIYGSGSYTRISDALMPRSAVPAAMKAPR